jgi:ribonuclease HI
MPDKQILTLWFDGLCEPVNPGGVPAYGWVIKTPEGVVLHEDMGIAPKDLPQTNNTAEYAALLEGLRFAQTLDFLSLEIRGDSKLVIEQINGRWNCNAAHLLKLRNDCQALLTGIRWTATWMPREQNEHADGLSRRAYENYTGKKCPTRR